MNVVFRHPIKTWTRRIYLFLGITGICFSSSALALDCPIGWAAVNALGQNGTTGGGNGTVVHVSTKSAFITYAGAATPYTIIVDSTSDSSWTNTAIVNVASHKTIIGANNTILFDGFGLSLDTASNVIVRNLTIKNVNPTDAFAMRTSHHVWIDHCDFSACADGLLDSTVGSDYLTVSWTILHNHDKVSLMNGGTQHFEDVGKERGTYHHDWFRDNVQRNPRIGYGQGHVFNNYYTNISSYCVGYHTGASVLVESNYFLNSANPLNQMYSGVSWEAAYADAKSVGNLFVSCSGSTADTGKAFDPETYYTYKFAADTAANVPAAVKSGAGPMASGATHLICPTPGQGAIDFTTASPNLLWTTNDGALSWDVYFGTTASPAFQLNTTARSFNPGTLLPNTDYFWRVDVHTAGGTVTGDLFRFHTAATNAAKPFPANNELHAPLRMAASTTTTKPVELTWTPGFNVATNLIYFGTNAALTAGDYKGAATSSLYAPGPLVYGQTYYWRIDTVQSNGTVVAGTTWNFKSDVTYSTTGRTECENMVPSARYFKENDTGWFPASGLYTMRLEGGTVGDTHSPGTLSTVWAGTNVLCNISVNYYDESTGSGWYALYVNQTKITEWFASANDNLLHTNLISNVSLNTGDELRIAAYSDLTEFNRSDCIDVAVVSGAPAAPTGLAVIPGDARVTLTWNAVVGATGYIVKRFTASGGPYVNIVTNIATTYVDTGVVNGTIYYYVVSTLGVLGESGNSAEVSASPQSYWPATRFKSNGVGGGGWNSVGTWQMSTNGGTGWVTATVFPTSANDTVEILSNDVVTLSGGLTIDQITVDHGGQLAILTEVTTITNGASVDLDIHGTLLISSNDVTSGTITLANNAAVVVEADGVIQSQYNNAGSSGLTTADPFAYGTGSVITNYGTYKMQTIRGTVPACKWQTGSTLEISPAKDGAGNQSALGMNQSFYNVVINLSTQSADVGAFANLTTILGDLTFTSTGGKFLALVSGGSQTLTLSGNVNLNGTSKVNLFSFSSGSPSTVVFQKNLTVASTATMGINYKNFATTQSVNFSGAGTISIGSGTIVENTGGAAAYLVNGTYTLAHDWRLNSISGLFDTLTVSGTLDCGPYVLTNTTAAGINNTFTLNSGATLKIGSTNGITASGASGNIQVAGTRTFDTAANYVYLGTAGQVTGTGLPATVNSLTISNTAAAVALSQNVTATSLKVAANAVLDFNGKTNTVINAPVLNGGLKMEVTKSGNSFTGSKLQQTAGTLAYGGTLTVTASGTLTNGDIIDLFDAPAFNAGSSFISTNFPVLSPGLSWSTANLAMNGSLLIYQSPTGPGNITNRVNGTTLTLTWPKQQGWRLVSQTNSLSIGLTTNGWGTVSGGIDGSNSILINPATPTVFYRLVNP